MKSVWAIGCWLVLAGIVSADDPELIPLNPPTPVPQPVIVSMPTAYERVSMYDRWQNYGVDRTGHFRPRVVLDFPEPRYLYSGKVYPMLPIHQRDYIPMMMN